MPYHVKIEARGRDRDLVVLDKDAAWVERTIVGPRRRGEPILFKNETISWNDIRKIYITETDQTSKQMIAGSSYLKFVDFMMTDMSFIVRRGQDVTDDFLTGAPSKVSAPSNPENVSVAADRKAVMVIYGHDQEANTALFDWLRAIGLKPREWSQLVQTSQSAGPYIGDVLDQAFKDAQAVIAFFTPDEYVLARTSLRTSANAWRLQARPNVLIEAGMALVTHPSRTVLVILGPQELPSDLAGRHYVHLSRTSTEPLHSLASRLRDAGCDIDQTGSDWLNPARFPDRDSLPPQPPTGTRKRSSSGTQVGTGIGEIINDPIKQS